MIEAALYHVPAENVPVVTAEIRQRSSATFTGAPEGCAVAVKLAAGISTLYVMRENRAATVVPTVQPVVLVEAAGWVRSSVPALASPRMGLFRKKVKTDAAIHR